MIPIVQPFLPPRDVLIPRLEETLYSGYIAEGEKVKQFETKLSQYLNNELSISLNSGTAALHIALILAGVKSGDEVISTALTAEPTNVTIIQTGAKVVWADVDPNTGTICPESVLSKITSKTKAIMVVHYAGIVANLEVLLKISKEHGIPLIEDAAHALGAKYQDKMIGTISDYTIFSFQAIKHMTTVDGGLLALKNQLEFNTARELRWFGLSKTIPRLENNINKVGFKYNMNDVNATIGLVQMDYIKQTIDCHINNGIFFDENLKDMEGIKTIKYYSQTKPSYWLYTLKVEKKENFRRWLNENNIATSELHLRNDRHEIFGGQVELPNLDTFYSEMIHFGCGWWIDTEKREYILNIIKKGW